MRFYAPAMPRPTIPSRSEVLPGKTRLAGWKRNKARKAMDQTWVVNPPKKLTCPLKVNVYWNNYSISKGGHVSFRGCKFTKKLTALRILTPQERLFWGPKNTPANYTGWKSPKPLEGPWGFLGWITFMNLHLSNSQKRLWHSIILIG